MAPKRKLDEPSAPEAAPAPESPTAYRDAASALINLLDGFLVPLVAARDKLAAAGDAEAYISQAQQRFDALNEMIAARQADVKLANDQVEAAQRGAQERVVAERQRVADERARATAEIERVRQDKAEALAKIETEHAAVVARMEGMGAALTQQIDAKRGELARLEQQLAAAREAQARFREAAGVGG